MLKFLVFLLFLTLCYLVKNNPYDEAFQSVNQEQMETVEATFIPDEKRNEIDKMHDALTSIADEIQRFEESEIISFMTPETYTVKCNDVLKSKLNCKSKLKSKEVLVAKLRKDLKAVCWVVKTLESVKKRESTSLTAQLVYARGECVDLLERYSNNIEIIGNLSKMNESLHEKLKTLINFIHLGYKELKKIQTEITEEPTALVQLKMLIESCGQYYADYCNKLETCQKMKHRNRFLKYKIINLENNIQATKEQIKALEHRNARLETENKQLKAKKLVGSQCLNVPCTEVKMKKCEGHKNSTNGDSGDSLKDKGYDLSTHLDIVKQLLSDQDILLKDLTIITKEISR